MFDKTITIPSCHCLDFHLTNPHGSLHVSLSALFYGNNLHDLQLFCLSNPDMDQLDPVLVHYNSQFSPRDSQHMMTSSNENIFRVTGPLCGEFTGHQWIPHTKVSDTELWFFFDLPLNKGLSKLSWDWWFEMPSHSLWCHCNEIAHLLCGAQITLQICDYGHTIRKLTTSWIVSDYGLFPVWCKPTV